MSNKNIFVKDGKFTSKIPKGILKEIKKICRIRKIDIGTLLDGSKERPFVNTRVEIVFLLRDKYNFGFQNIADILNLKSHCAILYLYKKRICD